VSADEVCVEAGRLAGRAQFLQRGGERHLMAGKDALQPPPCRAGHGHQYAKRHVPGTVGAAAEFGPTLEFGAQ
jgi:hypothetical protein